MQEDALRLLIRDAIARHLGTDGSGRSPNGPHAEGRSGNPPPGEAGYRRVCNAPYLRSADSPSPVLSWKTHLSHGRFVFLAPTEPDAPCVVEPEVRCHHCGFCQSYGH